MPAKSKSKGRDGSKTVPIDLTGRSPDRPKRKGEKIDLTASSPPDTDAPRKKKKVGGGEGRPCSQTLALEFIAWVEKEGFDFSETRDDAGWDGTALMKGDLKFLKGFADLAVVWGYGQPDEGKKGRTTRNYETESHKEALVQKLTDPLMRTLRQIGSGMYTCVLYSDTIGKLEEVVEERDFRLSSMSDFTRIWEGRAQKYMRDFIGTDGVRTRMEELAGADPHTLTAPACAVVGAARAFLCAADGHWEAMLKLIRVMTKKKRDRERFAGDLEARCRVCRRRVSAKSIGPEG